MDYKSLLSLAEKRHELNNANNQFNAKKRHLNGYNSGPDKSAVNAFKARKEREEMEKKLKAMKEKERLMSLRAQNSKSMKKANMMKTRTKDNDFSRIVLTAEQIEEQRRVEEKLQKKGITDVRQRMKTRIDMEEEEVNGHKKTNKKTNNSINNSNSNYFPSERHNIKNNSRIIDKSKDNKNINENSRKSEAPKPLSYNEVMKMASEKAKNEISLSDELMNEIKTKKQNRPMTQKEKEALREEMFYKQRAQKGLAKLPNPNERKNVKLQESRKDSDRDQNINKTNRNNGINTQNYNNNNSNKILNSKSSQRPVIDNRVKKMDEFINKSKNNQNQRPYDRPTENRERIVQNKSDLRRGPQNSSIQSNKSAILNKMNNRMNEKNELYNERIRNSMNDRSYDGSSDVFKSRPNDRSSDGFKSRPNDRSNDGLKSRPYDRINDRSSDRIDDRFSDNRRQMNDRSSDRIDDRFSDNRRQMNDRNDRRSPYSDRERPRISKSNDDYGYQNRRESNGRARVPSPPPRRPVSNLPPIGSTYRRGMYEDVAQYVDDDYEEEEDDDMSDFIDDGPQGGEEDVSATIRQIFGYDKRKYRNIDDDDDIEEANYAQCMKEESRSLRIGIQEDLEDMRQEEEEKRLKLLQKKKMKR